MYLRDLDISVLKGKTITAISGMEKDSDDVLIRTADGYEYRMYHRQNCCECVTIDDVIGDVEDLIGSEILIAECVKGETPAGWEPQEYTESYTWTFYKLATQKGYVDLRWFGESNGYYSEEVDFDMVESPHLKVFARTVEEKAALQIAEMSECEAYKGCTIRIMPDCHAGKGCTIGTVIELKHRVVPNTVGVDIGCGMLAASFPRHQFDLEEFDRVVHEQIPSGFSIHERAVADFPDLKDLRCRQVIDLDMARRSLGSLGGGNHFIEVNVDDRGTSYIVIHSGSRNLGVRICDYYQKLAVEQLTDTTRERNRIIAELKAAGREKDIQAEIAKIKKPAINPTLAYLHGEDKDNYMHDMDIAQRYAMKNRETMLAIICQAMGVEPADQFHTIHNYVERYRGEINDWDETYILRKGAVRADKGDRIIIPMNMRDGSLLCRGKGNGDWLLSAPHGAGRLMSRRKAFDTLKIEDFEREMSAVYSTSVCPETIDESPMAYKPMQEIIDCIGDTVEIEKIIRPVYNFKAKQ